MKTLKEKIEVMQAAFDGKEIEFRIKEKWYPMPESEFDTAWNWEGIDYRIKPEPMEFWVNFYKNDNPGFETEEYAKRFGENFSNYIKTIKVREVIE